MDEKTCPFGTVAASFTAALSLVFSHMHDLPLSHREAADADLAKRANEMSVCRGESCALWREQTTGAYGRCGLVND